MNTVRFTSSVNRVLWPRLRALGFRLTPRHSDGPWKEGTVLERFTGSSTQPQGVLLGRSKFGHAVGVNVSRPNDDGSYEWLNLTDVGISTAALEYRTQDELDAALGRLALAFEGPILAWLNGTKRPGVDATQ